MAREKRIVVKLDEKLFEMKEQKDGKLIGKVLDETATFEAQVLEEGVEKLLENDVQKLTQEAYEELKDTFKHNIKSTILASLGFEADKWGNNSTWKVDHCNQRKSDITEYLSQKTRELFRSEVDPVITTMMPELMKEVSKEIRKEFKDNFIREVKRNARSAAEEAAKTFVQELMTKEVQKLQKKAIAEVSTAFLGRKVPAQPDDYDDEEP